MVIYDCYTERCEYMECTNDYGKKNQCYDQGSETFQSKYYCDDHLKKIKAENGCEQPL